MDVATAQVRSERVADLASIDRQRLELLASLTPERIAAASGIELQRVALLTQLDELRRTGVTNVHELTTRIIRRGSRAVALLLVLAAGLALIVRRFGSRAGARGDALLRGATAPPGLGAWIPRSLQTPFAPGQRTRAPRSRSSCRRIERWHRVSSWQ